LQYLRAFKPELCIGCEYRRVFQENADVVSSPYAYLSKNARRKIEPLLRRADVVFFDQCQHLALPPQIGINELMLEIASIELGKKLSSPLDVKDYSNECFEAFMRNQGCSYACELYNLLKDVDKVIEEQGQ